MVVSRNSRKHNDTVDNIVFALKVFLFFGQIIDIFIGTLVSLTRVPQTSEETTELHVSVPFLHKNTASPSDFRSHNP